jgi:hypothetical protein
VAQATVGTVISLHPAVIVRCQDNRADFTLQGGVGHVPLRLAGLTLPPDRLTILLDGTPAKPATADTPAVPEKPGTPLDPAVHGREFWQIEPSLDGQSYSIIINLPASAAVRRITAGEPPPPPAELPDKKGAAR